MVWDKRDEIARLTAPIASMYDAVLAREDDPEALVDLHRKPAGPFPPYDEPTYMREAQLFTEWYCPALGLDVDAAGFDAAWREVLAPLTANQQPGVTVLRDYHAENIMLLRPDQGASEQGVIDFQDALVGHPAYDLVSLLQDARRDVSPELEAKMLARYREQADCGPEFDADYARLGAQHGERLVRARARARVGLGLGLGLG